MTIPIRYDRPEAEQFTIEEAFWKPFDIFWHYGNASKLGAHVCDWLGTSGCSDFPYSLVQEALGFSCMRISDGMDAFIHNCWLTRVLKELPGLMGYSRYRIMEGYEALGKLLFALGKGNVVRAIDYYYFSWNQTLLEEALNGYFVEHIDTDDGFPYYTRREDA